LAVALVILAGEARASFTEERHAVFGSFDIAAIDDATVRLHWAGV
jgi:hypothetical protein